MTAAPSAGPPSRPAGRAYTYSTLLRATHWLNVLLLSLMIASGIQIWWAYPAFGPGLPKPEALYGAVAGIETKVDARGINMGNDYRRFVGRLTQNFGIGGWLAGALRWHFAVMWPYTLNGLVFLLTLLLTAEGRHYRLQKGDFAGIGEMIRHPIRTFFDPPGEGKFNPIQKLAYNIVILAGVFSILTGLALYKRVQLGYLTDLFGGYQATRFWHFGVMIFFILFAIGHTLMVLAHGWRGGLAPMIVGLKAEREAFRARQRIFARRFGRVLAEAAMVLLAFWAGGLIAAGMNSIFGGQASGWILGVLLYGTLRLGPARIWYRRAREARLRRLAVAG